MDLKKAKEEELMLESARFFIDKEYKLRDLLVRVQKERQAEMNATHNKYKARINSIKKDISNIQSTCKKLVGSKKFFTEKKAYYANIKKMKNLKKVKYEAERDQIVKEIEQEEKAAEEKKKETLSNKKAETKDLNNK